MRHTFIQKFAYLAALAVASLHPALADAQTEGAPAPTPRAFAQGFDITVPESGAIYKIDLPDACLSLSVDFETNDIAVFNGENTLLPSARHYPTATVKSENIPAQVTTALWRADETETANTPSGTVIIVDRDRLAAAPLEEARQSKIVPSAYLALLPENRLTLTGISVRWKADQLSQIVRVRVECADDLNQDAWSVLADGPLAQVIADKSPALESVRFALPGVQTGKYLKISFPDLKAAPELLSVDVDVQRAKLPAFRAATFTLHPAMEPQALAGRETPSAVFEMDLSARKWTSSLEITPASPVIWRGVTLLGRDFTTQDWQVLRDFNLFKVIGTEQDSGAKSVSNSALVFQAELPRFLRIEVPASARGKSDLNVTAFYLQPELAFQAQEPGPYTLACGSGTVRVGADIDPTLLGLSGSAMGHVNEEPRQLGGPAALVAPIVEKPADKVRLALWAVLALGVAALGGMIFALYRNMKKGKK